MHTSTQMAHFSHLVPLAQGLSWDPNSPSPGGSPSCPSSEAKGASGRERDSKEAAFLSPERKRLHRARVKLSPWKLKVEPYRKGQKRQMELRADHENPYIPRRVLLRK